MDGTEAGDEMIYIKRWHHADCTIGRLYCRDFQCFTLELPDLGNQANISCIPPGRYRAFKRESPSNGLCIELIGVPGRRYIQIHKGNFTRDIKGCILVGAGVTFLDNDSIPDVSSSEQTLNKILSLLPANFGVTIN